jgi:protein-S-isoprenylcysteine O-methyltransferase Ste14
MSGALASSPAGPAPSRRGWRRAAAIPAAVTAALLLVPTIASACPVCFGDPNSAMAKGTNNGVFFLLGVIGFVQVGLGAMFVTFWRRARALRARREGMRVINGGLFR